VTGATQVRLEDLIGQARAVAVLRNAIRRERVTHAYLFCGPDSVGKSSAALLFAQALNCEAERPDGAVSGCGECHSCQLIASRNHPDVRFIGPTGGHATSVIPIADIRDYFVYDAQLKPVAGRYKIYLLDPAERTAPLAIHTILKVLEEPPPHVVTILVTSLPALLPSTILSRCQQVTFQLAGTEAIERQLVTLGVEPATAASLARLSGGRIAWAIRAAQRPEVLFTRKALLDLCAGLETRGLPASLRLAEEIKLQALALSRVQRESEAEEESDESLAGQASSTPEPGSDRALRTELPWCLDVMVCWYRDRLAAAQGAALLNPDYEQMLKRPPPPGLAHRAERAIEAILEAKHSIQRNANIDLALESLAMELLAGGD